MSKEHEMSFLKAASQMFSGMGQLMSEYNDALEEIENLKNTITQLTNKNTGLEIEICELINSKTNLEAEYYALISVPSQPVFFKKSKPEIIKTPPVKKLPEIKASGLCENCGNQVNIPGHRFCSRSCQVKKAHANRRIQSKTPEQQQPDPVAETETNTQKQ